MSRVLPVPSTRPSARYSDRAADAASGHTKLNVVLWTVQSILMLEFLFTGSSKLLMPTDLLAAQAPVPVEIVRVIGLFEVAGAAGMILPGLLRIRTALTPLAAACLVVLMVGATVLTPIMVGSEILLMLIPLATGLLAAFVGYARWRVVPLRSKTASPATTSVAVLAH